MPNPILAGLGPQAPTSSEASAAINQTIVAVNEYYAPLRPVMALSKDEKRSPDVDLDEVSDITGLRVVGAQVKGGNATKDSDRYVLYIAEDEQGKTSKGFLSYSDCPKSIAAHKARVALEVGSAKAARVAGGSEEVYGEDPRVETLTQEIERLQAEAREKPEPVEVQEPFADYQKASVADIEKRIAAVEDPLEREFLKKSVLDYETSWKGEDSVRKGVAAATKPVALVPAEDA